MEKKRKTIPFRFDEETGQQLRELQAAFYKEADRIRWNDKKPKYGIDFIGDYTISLNKAIKYAIKIAHNKVISKKDPKVISKEGSRE